VVTASIREKLTSGTGRPIVWDGSATNPSDGYLKAIKVRAVGSGWRSRWRTAGRRLAGRSAPASGRACVPLPPRGLAMRAQQPQAWTTASRGPI
jgi:hypothetical protein